MTEIDRNLRRRMIDAFKVRFHEKPARTEGYDDALFAGLEEAIAIRDAAMVPVNVALVEALKNVATAIETDDSGAIADTFWMPDSIIKGCTVVDYIQMAIESNGAVASDDTLQPMKTIPTDGTPVIVVYSDMSGANIVRAGQYDNGAPGWFDVSYHEDTFLGDCCGWTTSSTALADKIKIREKP